MQEQPLTTKLHNTFRTLDEMVVRHQQAEAYDRSADRLGFVHERLYHLHVELQALRLVAMHMQEVGVAGPAVDQWQRTLHELRSYEPPILRAPGAAIVAGSLELLALIEYTAAAAALVRERRRSIVHSLNQQERMTAASHDRGAGHDHLPQQAANVLLAQLIHTTSAEEIVALLTQ